LILKSFLLQGDISLPPKDEMWRDVQEKRTAMSKRFVTSQRHTIQVDYIGYMDELAKMYGCKPNLGKNCEVLCEIISGICYENGTIF